MRRLLVAAMIVGTAHGALAADMPDLPVLRGFVSDGPRYTRTNWEGYYVGGQGGFSRSEMNFANVNNDAIWDFNNNNRFMFPGIALPPFPPLGVSKSATAASIGGFAGYNTQWDDAIIGVELNYSHANLTGSFAGYPQIQTLGQTSGYQYQGITTSNASLTIHDFGSLRVRGGWVAGCFMPYVFAGVAMASGDMTRTLTGQVNRIPIANQVQDPIAPAAIPLTTQVSTMTNRVLYGYSAGFGTEVMLVGNLFVRGEYEYTRFVSPIGVIAHTARGGIGYKF